MPVIGFLNSQSPDGYADRLRGFRQGLKETGYIESENVAIEYRWAENQLDRLPAFVADGRRRDRIITLALLHCICRLMALRSYAENDAQRPLLEVKADSHVAVR
jgi:hypothetical protein